MFEIKDLRVNFGGIQALKGISLRVEKGEIVSLIGPSGSGKSTLLRVLMGLLPPVAGEVRIDGQALDYKDRAQLRRIRSEMAIVFQQYNLFQNMSVLDNVTVAPIKIKKRPRQQVEAYAKELLNKVGMGAKLGSYPDQLSGGQQQRVAIARALSMDPIAMLFDEPTSALDPEMINEVLDVMVGLAKEGMTMMCVTHEMGFAKLVADRIIFMDKGLIEEDCSKAEFFGSPRGERAQQFLAKILHS